MQAPIAARKDGRVIIHFDYDCFYASVFENKNPALKSLPFAVQQKQIIVTCNYEARRRGLHKLQLITDAKRICPDVIIELGEDISPFRDVSKELYNFIRTYSWNGKAERLGFDEVWLDVTDVIDYNMEILNFHNLNDAFFLISREDPTSGFAFDASRVAGHSFPAGSQLTALPADDKDFQLGMRLCLGSHLAFHIRHELERKKGYTSTVGIATTKLVSKLVGNMNKPKGQTTLLPPLESNTTQFLDSHEIGKIPGIGFKTAQKLREHVLGRPADFDQGLVYGGTKESITVADVRKHPKISADSITKLLAGPGSSHDVGARIWGLLHGVDDVEVALAKSVPSQISIEDSYIRLDTMPELLRQLEALARSLLERMRIDLVTDSNEESDYKGDSDEYSAQSTKQGRWLAHPRTLRLTTRPRQPPRPDGTRVRSFKRISHSAPLPTFVFSLHDSVEILADRLVHGCLVGMFHKLHPEKAGWNLSLVNLAVANMAETAGDSRTANGRDIGKMFRRQEDVLKDFRVVDESQDDGAEPGAPSKQLTEDVQEQWHQSPLSRRRDSSEDDDDECAVDGAWCEDDEVESDSEVCDLCGAQVPLFVMVAHQRFHKLHH